MTLTLKFDLLLKTLTMAITFKLHVEEIGLSYCTCVFLVTRPYTWYHNFLPCDLDLKVWPIYKNCKLECYLVMVATRPASLSSDIPYYLYLYHICLNPLYPIVSALLVYPAWWCRGEKSYSKEWDQPISEVSHWWCSRTSMPNNLESRKAASIVDFIYFAHHHIDRGQGNSILGSMICNIHDRQALWIENVGHEDGTFFTQFVLFSSPGRISWELLSYPLVFVSACKKTLILSITHEPTLHIPCDNALPWLPNTWPSDLGLKVWPTFKNINFDHNFLTRRGRAFIFQLCIPCGNSFHAVPSLLPVWVWPAYEKNLTLGITFEPEEIEHSCFTFEFLVTIPCLLYMNLWPSDHDLAVDLLSKNLYWHINFESEELI